VPRSKKRPRLSTSPDGEKRAFFPFLLIFFNFNLWGGSQTPGAEVIRPPPGGLRPPVPDRKLTDISQFTHINILPARPAISAAPGHAFASPSFAEHRRATPSIAEPLPCRAGPCFAPPRRAPLLLFNFQSRR